MDWNKISNEHVLQIKNLLEQLLFAREQRQTTQELATTQAELSVATSQLTKLEERLTQQAKLVLELKTKLDAYDQSNSSLNGSTQTTSDSFSLDKNKTDSALSDSVSAESDVGYEWDDVASKVAINVGTLRRWAKSFSAKLSVFYRNNGKLIEADVQFLKAIQERKTKGESLQQITRDVLGNE